MLYILFGILVGWVTTTVLFVLIPVAFGVRADLRRARELGIPDPAMVMRRRFFIPRRTRALHAALLDRAVWLQQSAYPAHQTRTARVTAVRAHSLLLDDGSVFEPRRMSRTFADGTGAATGTITDSHGVARALVVFA